MSVLQHRPALPFLALVTVLSVGLLGAALPPTASLSEAPAECGYLPGYYAKHAELVSFGDPIEGNIEASVTVVEFLDPNCAHCRAQHPIMKDVIATHGEQARFVMRPFALWRHSLDQIEALHAAAQEGLFMEMLDAQFRRQKSSGLSIDELKEIATEIGMDADALGNALAADRYLNLTLMHRKQGEETGLGGVPAIMINGRFVSDRSPDCLRQLIEEAAS